MTETLAPSFHMVPQHVARNPVARAIARARMVSATRAFRIQLHTLDPDQDVTSHISAARAVLAVAARVCGYHGEVASSIDLALQACAELEAAGYRWSAVHAAALNVGMTDALEVYTQAGAAELNRAYAEIFGRTA